MRLIGMLDSPYVRRVAVALDLLDIPFQLEPISVFSTFAQFSAINPVVKAPTLVCDDGGVLMDSSLILQYLETRSGRSLWSTDAAQVQAQFEAVGVAVAACEKCVQIVYERKLRPLEIQFEPWMQRVTGQVLAAFTMLEQQVRERPQVFADSGQHPAITAAIVWEFTQSLLPQVVPAASYPRLAALATRVESSAPFKRYPSAGV